MEGLQQRKEELERKEYQLAESLLKFDRFLKENDARRRRALKKAEEERDLTMQKSKDVKVLKDEIDHLKSRQARQVEAIRKNILFQKYLGSVIEKSPEFSEVNEILARYATLSSTNKVCLCFLSATQPHGERIWLSTISKYKPKSTSSRPRWQRSKKAIVSKCSTIRIMYD
jgi:hypothetical protein